MLVFPPNLDPSIPFPELSATQVADLVARRLSLMQGHLDHWNATQSKTGTGRPIDAIIAPPAAAAAFQCGTRCYQGYTEFCNFHDYTTAVFPVTAVCKETDRKETRRGFLSDWDRLTDESCKSDAGTYDAPGTIQ